MMKKIGAAFVALFFFATLVPVGAQFADQATQVTSVSGTNAITGTLPNVVSCADLYGVLVKLTPVATNTGAATFDLNGVCAGNFKKPTDAGIASLTGGELVTGQPVIMMVMSSNDAIILSVTNTTVGASNLANSALSAMSLPVNMQINAAVSANQLTVSLCTINSGSNTCNNPSATSPVLISFRDVTAANGDPAIISQQAALGMTALSTSNFGCITATTCRLWVVGINNAGTMALCVFNALSGTSVAPINEAANQTSQSGTSGGASAQLYYCSTSAVTGKAIRILGYVEATWVSGTGWSTTPSLVQIFGPGIKKPGDIVQTVSPAPIGTTTVLGTAETQTAITASITPTSAANIISAHAEVSAGNSSSTSMNLRFSRGTGPTLFGGLTLAGSGSGIDFPMSVFGRDVPSTTNATSYYIYGQCSNASSCTVNQSNVYAPLSTITLDEIMSSLDPANDDQQLRMVG